MRSLKRQPQGFSLMELLIGMFIFLVVMTATVQLFGKEVLGYKKGRVIQHDLEDAQATMNNISKVLRTSTVVSSTVSRVEAFDYSQGTGKCVVFQIDTVARRVRTGSADPGTAGDLATCSFSAITVRDMTSANVIGRFDITRSAQAPARLVGKATLSLDVSSDNAHHARVQTTVSLRDYGYIGL